MVKILISILNMSIAGSIVAVFVMLMRFPLKKYPKIFSYALWIVVLMRLIFPLQIESKVSFMPTNAEIIPTTIVSLQTPRINSGIEALDTTVNSWIVNAAPTLSGTVKTNPINFILTIGSYIWLSGMVLFLVFAIINCIRLKGRIYDATLVSDNVYETDKISNAFLFGFIRPRIYVSTLLTDQQFHVILKHEQVHIDRRDYLIKLIFFFVLTVHWFNPVIWISFYLMSKDMEMSCDEAVLKKSNLDIRKDYSIAMVSLYTKNSNLISPFTSFEGGFKNMKARIKNVLHFKKAPLRTIILCSLFVLLFMVGFIANPMTTIKNDPSVKANNEIPAFDNNVGNETTLIDYKVYNSKKETENKETSITAYSRTNNWAMASGIAGKTKQQILDNKLKFIEGVWKQKEKEFIIGEGIFKDEITDMESLQYMYDKSSIYRNLLKVEDTLYIRPETYFTYYNGNGVLYSRHAFLLTDKSKLALNMKYKTDNGKISVFVVSSSGKIVHQVDSSNKWNKTVTLELDKGINSIVVAYENESKTNGCRGEINIMGKFKK